MKKMMMIFLCGIVMNGSISFAQVNGRASAEAATCTCLPGYQLCQANALFMSCCTCCQPGLSCGGWTAFGMCSCRCENMNVTPTAKIEFYPERYADFMLYLEKNGLNAKLLRNYALEAIEGLRVINNDDEDPLNDTVILTPAASKTLTDKYIGDILQLNAEPRVAEILEIYLGKTNTYDNALQRSR